MNLDEILNINPYNDVSFRDRFILHQNVINLTEQSVISFAYNYPQEYDSIKDLIKMKSLPISLMNKLSYYYITNE